MSRKSLHELGKKQLKNRLTRFRVQYENEEQNANQADVPIAVRMDQR